ncbi:MAG: hypothetical protein CVV27_10950 [Candidatus Melainabacteria bacterium HGW-Melainabacteria-1]|nr:MAG: hypothetical protein CVV27_10950 [Candidatus Melainabacteria bacterium HGW-Melainabacteria-1]
MPIRLRPVFTLPLIAAICLSACQSGPMPTNRAGLTALGAAVAGVQALKHVDGEGDMLRLGREAFGAAQKQGLGLSSQGDLVLNAGQSSGQLTSPILKAPYDFDALMPAWNGSGQIEVLVRVSADGKAWGGWLPALPERTMLLPKRAQFIQYQLRLSAPATRLEGLSFQFGRKRPQVAAQRRSHPIPKPALIDRAGWKAAPPKSDYTTHTPAAIVVHHTWLPRASQYQQGASIRGIQRYHMVDNKWMDIGYHFLIGPEGVIYQGRPETVVGAHSTPNTNYIGICVFGDFDPGQDPFTDASRAALLDLMTWLTAEYGIQTSEFYGHRDFSNKSCPGDGIYHHLQSFKDEVTRRLQDAGVLPKGR